MLAVGTRVIDPENGATGTVITTPPGYFEPRRVRPTWLVFVAWDHLDGGWTPEDYRLLEV